MITSTANQAIKDIKKLKDRKYRQSTGLFYLEGLRLVGEAVQTGASIEAIIYSTELLCSEFGQNLVQEQAKRGIAAVEVSADVFRHFSLKDNPQGIAAAVHQRWHTLADVNILKEGSLWIALDSIQNPGNLGTILRTGDAFGAEGVLLLDQSTDPYDPTSMRSSMGAVFSQKLVRVTLQELGTHLQDNPFTLVGASGNSPVDYYQVYYPDNLILLMGSEREGLNEKHLKMCNYCVRIPMVGRSDSLNVSIAAAVILSEVFKQRNVRKQ